MTFLKNKIKELRRSKKFKDFISFLLIYLILILVFILSYQFVKLFNTNTTDKSEIKLNSTKNIKEIKSSSPKNIYNKMSDNSINSIKNNNSSPNIENKVDVKLPLNYSKDIIDEIRDIPKPLNNVYDIEYNI